MRKLLLAGVAIAALGVAPAIAQEPPVMSNGDTLEAVPDRTQMDDQTIGTTAGGATGAVAGAVVGGPVGAVVGGFAGAVIGAATSVPPPAREYVVAHPVEPAVIDEPIEQGYVMPSSAALEPIPDYPEYAYTYVDGRPVIVRMESREVVYSPGYVVPDRTVTYIEENPVEPVIVDTEISTGSVIPDEVEIVPVPDDPAYGYIYTEQGPVLVNEGSRTVVWTR